MSVEEVKRLESEIVDLRNALFDIRDAAFNITEAWEMADKALKGAKHPSEESEDEDKSEGRDAGVQDKGK